MTSDEDFELLAIGLRAQARTAADLAALALRPESEVQEGLRALAEAGYVSLAGDDLVWAPPVQAVAADVRRQATELVDQLSVLADRLARTADHGPGLAESSSWSGSALEVELFHGESAVTDLWHHLIKRTPLRRTDVMLPDASPLAVPDLEMQRVWHQVINQPGNRARVLASVTDIGSAGLAERLAQELAAGLQVRMRADLPSWFWVADGEVVALPLVWGERWPTSVMAVRNAAMAGVAGWVFEQLWHRGVDPLTDTASWDPLLRLMSTGSTLEASAHALGISDRTGRRRISDAMDYYGVASQLALGVAWGASRRR
ncbi:hypothetical protein [Nocardioides terrae]|uniref:hypothetical protein n=1 Tax=Nocardioides terrae TaxID=574651 RepID=UPI000B82AD8B|nr:hypothetical protein [Nocardioides terrae]